MSNSNKNTKQRKLAVKMNGKTVTRDMYIRSKEKWADRNQSTGFPRFYTSDPFPPKMYKSLTYSTIIGLSSTAAGNVGTTKILGLNCLYDPDISGVGHQPYGFDQLCTSTGPYLRYKVNNVHIKVTCITQDTNDTWAVFAVHNAASSATIAGLSLDVLPEKQNTRIEFIPNTGSQQKVLHFTFGMETFPDLFGWSKQEFASDVDGSTGAHNSNPGTIPRFEFGVASAKVPIATMQAIVEMTFHTQFYGRSQMSSS